MRAHFLDHPPLSIFHDYNFTPILILLCDLTFIHAREHSVLVLGRKGAGKLRIIWNLQMGERCAWYNNNAASYYKLREVTSHLAGYTLPSLGQPLSLMWPIMTLTNGNDHLCQWGQQGSSLPLMCSTVFGSCFSQNNSTPLQKHIMGQYCTRLVP